MNNFLQTTLITAVLTTSGLATEATRVRLADNTFLCDGADITAGNTLTMKYQLYNAGIIQKIADENGNLENEAKIETSENTPYATILNLYKLKKDETHSEDNDFKVRISELLGDCVKCTSEGTEENPNPCYKDGTHLYELKDVYKIEEKGEVITEGENAVILQMETNEQGEITKQVSQKDAAIVNTMIYMQEHANEDILGDHRVFNIVVPEDASSNRLLFVEEGIAPHNMTNIDNASATFVTIPGEGEKSVDLECSCHGAEYNIPLPILRGFEGTIFLKGMPMTLNNTNSQDLTMQGSFASEKMEDGMTSDINFWGENRKIIFNGDVNMAKANASFDEGSFVFKKKLVI